MIGIVLSILASIGGCVYHLNRELGERTQENSSFEKRLTKIEDLKLDVVSFKVEELWGKYKKVQK